MLQAGAGGELGKGLHIVDYNLKCSDFFDWVAMGALPSCRLRRWTTGTCRSLCAMRSCREK